MSNRVYRRSITALFLFTVLVANLPISAFARSTEVLDSTTTATLKLMGEEAFVWYRLLLAVSIPILICRYASHGFQLLGNTFLTKGEYALDRIKKDIFYSTIALISLAMLPLFLGWAMDLFSANQWKPPAPSYISG